MDKGKVAFVVMWICLSAVIRTTNISGEMWRWWQDNLVETAYQGPDPLVPTEWWAAPAVIGSFFVPWVPYFLAGLATYGIYLFLEHVEVEEHR